MWRGNALAPSITEKYHAIKHASVIRENELDREMKRGKGLAHSDGTSACVNGLMNIYALAACGGSGGMALLTYDDRRVDRMHDSLHELSMDGMGLSEGSRRDVCLVDVTCVCPDSRAYVPNCLYGAPKSPLDHFQTRLQTPDLSKLEQLNFETTNLLWRLVEHLYYQVFY